MSFLLDTDTCSAHLRRPAGLMHRFVQYSGRLYLSSITLGELYVWAYSRDNPASLLHAIREDLLADVVLLPFDETCAEEFGRLRGSLLRQGISASRIDLMIGSIALIHDLTLVTHNTGDFQKIPNLRLADWLSS